jgi:hypothetical protein
MMNRYTIFLLSVVISCAGCATAPQVTSLYPVVPVENAFLDPTIVGTWTVEETGEIWKFFQPEKKEEGEEGKYPWFLTVTDETGQVSLYQVDHDMLGETPVLQVYPAYHLSGDYEEDLLFWLHVHTLPLYRIYRAQISDREFVLTELDSRRINRFLKDSPGAVEHLTRKGRLILTSHPVQTREFLSDGMEDREAFWSRKVLRMTRKEPEPTPAPEEGAP